MTYLVVVDDFCAKSVVAFVKYFEPKMNQIDDGRTLSPLLDQAPENVLESVLHFLTSRHDRNAASLVYKSWYHAEALTRTELFIKNCYVVSPHRASTQFPRVWSVTINGKPCFADFDLMPLNWGSTSPLRPPHSPNLTTHSSTNSTSNTCPSLTMTSASSPTPSPPSKTSFSRAVKALAPPLLPPSPLTTVRLVVVLQSIVGKHINRVFTFDKVLLLTLPRVRYVIISKLEFMKMDTNSGMLS
ncbi:hypothetical protein JHK87_012020 [Glycine soja]|nr:hypothetical protein JHK87_012020 [Glycine soja]